MRDDLIAAVLSVSVSGLTGLVNATLFAQSVEWLPLLREFGLPLTMLAICGFWMSRAIVWLANKALLPLVNKHIDFISVLESVLRAQNETLTHMGNKLDSISATEKANLETNSRASATLERIDEGIATARQWAAGRDEAIAKAVAKGIKEAKS